MADRPKHRKGYNPGEDEEVYEALKGAQHKIDANKNGKVDAHDFHLLRKKKKVAEEAEELDELSTEKLLAYRKKAREADTNKHHVYADEADKKIKKKTGVYNPNLLQRAKAKLRNEEAEQIDELKRETVRTYYNKAIAQGKPIADKMKMVGGDFSSDGSDTKTLRKRGAGVTMALKRRRGEIKMSEDSEQINELSKKTLGSYVIKSLAPSSEKSVSNLASKGGYKLGQAHDDDYTAGEKEDAKSVKRSLGVLTAVRKMTKEQSELEEKLDMKKASMGTVVKDFQKSDAPQFMGKSQKKRQVMAIAAKLSAERGDKPLNKEERLLTKLADISETHQRTMISVFEKLNEDNQYAFMQACDTADGIEQMLDFSISYRGE
jgi:hypothetical protein